MVGTTKVYKYPFEISSLVEVAIPKDHKILLVECQGQHPCIWAQVNLPSPTVVKRFRIYGTGHEIDPFETISHVASFQQGPFVWHMYEIAV